MRAGKRDRIVVFPREIDGERVRTAKCDRLGALVRDFRVAQNYRQILERGIVKSDRRAVDFVAQRNDQRLPAAS